MEVVNPLITKLVADLKAANEEIQTCLDLVDDMMALQQEVKALRLELAEKEAKIRRLEDYK